MKPVNATQLTVCFCGGLAKLPRLEDPEMWGTTAEVADMLRVTPQRIGQLVAEEGLPKAGRDRFYLPDVFNFQTVQVISQVFRKRPLDMNHFTYVDFTLGRDSPINIPPETFQRSISGKKEE